MELRQRLLWLLAALLSIASSITAFAALFTGRNSFNEDAGILSINATGLNSALHSFIFDTFNSSFENYASDLEQYTQVLFQDLPYTRLHFLSTCGQTSSIDCSAQPPNYELSTGQFVIDSNDEQFEGTNHGSHYALGFGIEIQYPSNTTSQAELMMTLEMLQSEADELANSVRSALGSWAQSGPNISFSSATILLAFGLLPISVVSVVLLVIGVLSPRILYPIHVGLVAFIALSALLFTTSAALVTSITKHASGVSYPLAISPEFITTVTAGSSFTGILWTPMALAWVAASCLLCALFTELDRDQSLPISAPLKVLHLTPHPAGSIQKTIQFVVTLESSESQENLHSPHLHDMTKAQEEDEEEDEEEIERRRWLAGRREAADEREARVGRHLGQPCNPSIRVSRFSDVSSLSSDGGAGDGGRRNGELGRQLSAVSRM